MKHKTYFDHLDELAVASLEKLYNELSLAVFLEDNTALRMAAAMLEVELAYWDKFKHHCMDQIQDMLDFTRRQLWINMCDYSI